MGLIKAATGAAGGTLADQWKEFFYSDSLDNDTLMVRGKKRTDRRSSNTKGHDNVITNVRISKYLCHRDRLCIFLDNDL